MKLIKQTVYLPLYDEWKEGKPTLMNSDGEWVCNLQHQEGYFFTPEQLNEYTKSVIEQALKTAADKANMKCKKNHNGEFPEHWNINKQSITSTFDETFKKFEV